MSQKNFNNMSRTYPMKVHSKYSFTRFHKELNF
jgi:hypothetical protein